MRPTIVTAAAFVVWLAACSPQAGPSGSPSPSADGALFEVSRKTDRGFDRVREVERHHTVAVLRVETDYYGGAMGSAYFGMDCLNRLCKARGFSHWVILDQGVVRTGDTSSPGNDWSVTIGLMSAPAASSEMATLFPELGKAHREYQIHAAHADPAKTDRLSMMKSKDLWDVFSSVHFRFGK